jgi:hypothetical protein
MKFNLSNKNIRRGTLILKGIGALLGVAVGGVELKMAVDKCKKTKKEENKSSDEPIDIDFTEK